MTRHEKLKILLESLKYGTLSIDSGLEQIESMIEKEIDAAKRDEEYGG